MSILFNFLVIVMILLIAYWWSNQGLFSGLLHLIAVVVAGAITLAIWEHLVWGLALGSTGKFFDNYVTGLAFILVFVGLLALLRLASDYVIEDNVPLSRGLDLAGGFATGSVAGILAVGMLLIGIGFLQRPHEFLGYKGFGRAMTGDSPVGPIGQQLWVPADAWTSSFYEWASVTGLRPDIGNTPLRQYNPELYKQASLIRDGLDGENSQTFLVDGAVEVLGPPKLSENVDGNRRMVSVPVKFDTSARDFGRQLTLSKSHVRLIGDASGTEAPAIVYPSYWVQDTAIEGAGSNTVLADGFYKFDGADKYLTSVPGRESTKATLIFEVEDAFTPRFIQIKGVRLDLRPMENRDFASVIGNAEALGAGFEFLEDPGGDITNAVTVGRNLKFLRKVSKNKMPSTMSETGGYLTNGFMRVKSGKASRVSRGLQLKGIAQTEGTNIVQIDVSRNSAANLFGRVRQNARGEDRIQLADANGNTYAPIGFYLRGPKGVEVKLNRRDFLRTYEQLGAQPASGGGEEMVLFFEVTNGETLDELRVGNQVVGYIEGISIGR